MSAARHLRFGYLVQVSSLLTLAMVNVGLPNWIGTAAFARLSEANAYVGFSCGLFNEGVALLLIRALQRQADPQHAARRLVLQGSLEHTLLCMVALAAVMVVTRMIAPLQSYAGVDWAIVLAADLVTAVYVCLVAWLTAALKNHVVAVLAMLQGLLTFLAPLALHFAGLDVRWSIALSYLPGTALGLVWLSRMRGQPWHPGLATTQRIVLVPALPAACAQAAMRIAIVWLPVMVLAGRSDVAGSAAYKIGLAMALGVCALVPFHRQTMLSLEGHADRQRVTELAAGALLLAAVGAVALAWLAGPVTRHLYQSDLAVMAKFLPAFGSFVVLQVFADVVLVRMMARDDNAGLMWSCGAALVVAVTVSQTSWPAWLPTLTLSAFLAVALIRQPMPELLLPARAAACGVLLALAAAALPPTSAIALAVPVLAMALVAVDAGLRRAVLRLVTTFTGRLQR